MLGLALGMLLASAIAALAAGEHVHAVMVGVDAGARQWPAWAGLAPSAAAAAVAAGLYFGERAGLRPPAATRPGCTA